MKRLLLIIAITVFFFPALAYAAWDGTPYGPNETLDPECSPSQTDCTVSLGFSVSGTNVSVGTTTPFGAAVLTVEATSTSAIGAVVRGVAGQVADLFRVVTSAGSTLFSINASGDVSMQRATTTGLTVTGLNTASCDVKADANGTLVCGIDQTSTGAANPFTWATNYGVLSAATSSALWAQSGIFASSTSYFAGATFTNATTTGRAYVGGYLGVGSTTPSVPLAVEGDAYIVGNLRVTGITTFGEHSWQITQNNDESFVLQSSRGDAGIFIDNTNGRVGIATNAPKSAFHFLDTINSDGDALYLENEEALSTYYRVGNRNAGYQFGINHYLGENFILQRVGFNPSFAIGSTTGYVGIASSSPAYQFSVEGTSSLGNIARAGYFIATSTTASIFPFASTTALSASTLCLSTDCRTSWPTFVASAFPFTPTALGNATSTLLQLTAGLISSASTTVGNGTATGGLTISGGATTTGNLRVQGTARFVQDATVDGTLYSYGTLYVNGPATFNEYTTFNEVTNFTSDVGFGSSTPYAKIGVQGNVLVSGNLGVANITATGTVTTANLTVSGIATTTGNAYFGGNVSIGTTSPITGLDIGNAVTATASGQVAGLNLRSILTGRSNTSDVYYGLKLVPTMIAGGNTQTMTGLYVAPNFNDNGKTGVVHYDAVFNGGGDVVIGASAAWAVNSTARLSVLGTQTGGAVNLDFKNNAFPTVGNEVRIRFHPYQSLVDDNASYISSIVTNAASGAGDLVLGVSNGGGGTVEAIRMRSSGNVGIGTTSPGTRLSVAGDAVVSGRIYGQYFTATSTLTASVFPFASTTALSATALCLATDCRTSWPTSSAFPFTPTSLGNSTSTLLQLIAGIITSASSTIGNGTQGLTVSGSATTTGVAYFASSVGVGTNVPSEKLDVTNGYLLLSNNYGIKLKDNTGIARTLLQLDNSNNFILGGGTGSVTGITQIRAGGATGYIGFATDNGGSELARLNYNGNFGLGSTSPYAKLSVTNTGTGPSFVVEDEDSPDGSAFIIDVSGNVGIGTASPQKKLHIVGTDGAVSSLPSLGQKDFLIIENNGNANMNLVGSATGSGEYKFTPSGASALRGSMKYDFSNDFLGFYTGGVTTSYKMTILSGGNVGIGTTTPWGKLGVSNFNGGTTPLFVVASSTGTGATSTPFIVDSYGNVGINSTGVTSAKLDVRTSGAGNVAMRLIADSFETAFRLSENSTFSNVDFSAVSGGSLRVDNAGYVVFNNTGNVGLGSTTPYSKLSVQKNYGNTAGSLFTVASSTASNGATASTFFNITSGGNAYFGGSVGVGTTTFANDLEVYTTGFTQAGISSNSSHAALSLNAASTFDPKIYFQTNYITRWSMGVDSSDSNKFFLGTNEVLPTSPLFTFTTGGELGVGTTSPSQRLTVDGGYTSLGHYLIIRDFDTNAESNVRMVNRDDNLVVWNSALVVGTPSNNTLGALGSGRFYVQDNTAVGADPLCWDGSGGSLYGDCTSLSKYKDNQVELSLGLEEVLKLTPREFDWVADKGGEHDLGFVAEEVAAVNPILARYDSETGKLQGVKYERLTSLLTKAIQEMNLNLEEIFASSTASSTPQSESFAERFMGGIFARMTAWFADAANGIQSMYANTFHAKDEICIGDTCVNEDQLKALLAGQAASPSVVDPEPEPEPTPELIEESTPEPEPEVEEVVPEDPPVEEVAEESAPQESEPQPEPVATAE